MLSDITNSIKAKLYDFTYTPFMSSTIISWIILNHKYLLIYFGDSKLDEKLTRLNEFDFSASVFTLSVPYAMNVWYPILFGLFYVFAYPWASKIFYEYTLKRTKELKKIKQDIEDETPLTRKEARYIIMENKKLLSSIAECEEKYIKLEEISNTEDTDVSNNAIDGGTFGNNIEDTDKQQEDDKTKVLRFFYESNYKTSLQSSTLDSIVNKTKLARPKAQIILNDLISEDILKKTDMGYVSVTNLGNSKLVEMFEEKNES